MKIKIKYKLFISFIILCSFSLLFTLVSIWMFDKENKISEQFKLLERIQLLTMEEYKLQQEFLLYETINPIFFKTGKSNKVEEYKKVFNEIISILNQLKQDEVAKQLFDTDFLSSILLEQNNYQHVFYNLLEETKKRGFKDFGIEGEMRDYAHALMEVKELDQINILMLRRHEKDFIIRKEEQYLQQFELKIKQVSNEIKESNKFSEYKKIKLDSLVNGYNLAFHKLVISEWVLMGKKIGSGLKFQLSQQHDFIINHIINQKQNAIEVEKKLHQNLLMIAFISMIFIILLAFILSYRLAYQLSQPIMNLNIYLNKYVESKFSTIPILPKRNTKDEITELGYNFFKMADEITSYIKFFEEKVAQRTNEINEQRIEILSQKTQINQQYEELVIKTENLEEQQKLILEINKDIMDSIRYAQRIQKAIMPSKLIIQKMIPTGFIYFKPRDIVSGDFYFLHQKGNKLFFAIGDATGHGVPGAFLSIIGIHAIHKALNEFQLENPAEILNKVNFLMEEVISSEGENIINDGMDIAFCCLELNTRILQYSGANIPLWIVREERSEDYISTHNDTLKIKAIDTASSYVIREIKANNQPIGHFDKRTPFINHSIKLLEGDMIYIFSDGYADQFGGPRGKKLKYSRLKNVFLDIHHYPTSEQRKEIKDTLLNWKGDFEQVDDICALGLRI